MKKRASSRNDKNEVPFILMLIGVIIGGLSALATTLNFFSNFAILHTFRGIIGIILTIILIPYVTKIRKNPRKNDFVLVTVLGAVGIFFGMGIGGILILIAGIIGLTSK